MTSGTAAVANFSSRILFNYWLDYSSSIICAYLVGMVIAFIMARKFVFTEIVKNIGRSALVFTLVNMIGMLQTWAISMLFVSLVLPSFGITHYAPEIAHAVGLSSVAFTSYLGHKHWSFR